MFDTAPITQLVNDLPQKSVTVSVLRALDFVVPGEWDNCTDVEQMVQSATGETREGRIQAIANHMDQLYNGELKGCQRAVWLYQTADSADKVLGTAALANKVGDKIGFLSFLKKLTPKPDQLQALDLALKVSIEAMAYASIHGLSKDSVTGFVSSLDDFGNESAMRMAAMICLDGLIPLGPDFLSVVTHHLNKSSGDTVRKHPVFSKLSKVLPGGSATQQLAFVKDAFSQAQGWMGGMVKKKGLSQKGLMSKLSTVVELSDDKLDYVGAFLDATTSYMTHTGTQTVARHLAQKAAVEFGQHA